MGGGLRERFMSISKMKLEDLSEDDLLNLVDDKVSEGREIEFKRALPANSDARGNGESKKDAPQRRPSMGRKLCRIRGFLTL
jgi:hypothetical protein